MVQTRRVQFMCFKQKCYNLNMMGQFIQQKIHGLFQQAIKQKLSIPFVQIQQTTVLKRKISIQQQSLGDLSDQINQMQHKRDIYHNNQKDKIPIVQTSVTKHKQKQFDFSRISQIDDLLTKNEQIYKNLRKKLQDINEAERNITNNINVIKPISYGTYERQVQTLQYEQMFSDNNGYRVSNFENYISSPIQTQRLMNESLRKRIQGSQSLSNLEGINNQKQNQFQRSNHLGQDRVQKPTEKSNQFRRNNSVYQNFSIFQEPYSHKHFQDSSYFLDTSNLCFMSKSYEPLVDSLVRMNFLEISKRKEQIEQIYQQLKQEEEQIERSYQQYKKCFATLNSMSTKKQENVVKSPAKKQQAKKGLDMRSSPSKSFDKKSSPQKNQSKITMNQKLNEQSTNQMTKQTTNSFQNTTKTLQSVLSQNNITQHTQKSEHEPIRESMINYCSEQLQTTEIPNKPRVLNARSHIFVPFNKLYKSPIIQMKNKNTLILARQSKQAPLKTAQNKIIDGKKYKFANAIQTDEQQLIKNLLRHDYNMIAIIGGQQTLKKKLHMSIIAHSIDRILKVINNSQQNCLSLGLSYQQYVEKSPNCMAKVNNLIQINQNTSIKLVVAQIQKTLEEIYQAIKKTNPLQQTLINKPLAYSTKEKSKSIKFTKLSLMSGKDFIWVCHILSANQISFEFLKNLEVKDIVWSINPLIKNYDDVSKTLNQAAKYIDAMADV